MSFWRQLRVLLWKNFLLKRRKWCLTLIELVLPLMLSFILVVFRILSPTPLKPFPETVELARPLPSAGLSVLATVLCPNYPDWKLSKDGIPVYANNSMTEFLNIVNELASGKPELINERIEILKAKGADVEKALLRNESDSEVIEEYVLAANDLAASWSPLERLGILLGKSIPAGQKSCDDVRGGNSSDSKVIPIDYGAIVLQLVKTVVCGEKVVTKTGKPGEPLSKPSENDGSEMSKILKILWRRAPKILFVPSESKAVQDVMFKANATFRMLDKARMWAQNFSSFAVQEGLLETHRRMETLLERNVDVGGFFSKVPSKADDPSREALCILSKWLQGVDLDVFRGFPDEIEMEEFRRDAYAMNTTVVAGIVFDVETNQTHLPKRTTFTIRQNASLTTTTRAYRNLFKYPGPRSWDKSYYNYGFLFIQDVIERAIVDTHANESVREPGSFIQFMPFPCYFDDKYLTNIESVFSLAIVLSCLYSCALLVENIVVEKELRLKDVMNSMGMGSSVLFTSWFLTQFVISTVAFILLTAVLCLGKVLTYSNPFTIFILLELFGISTILLALLIASFFSKAKMATACAGIIYFITFLPYLYVTIREMSTSILLPSWIKILSSLFSSSAMGLAMRYVLFEEMKGTGANFENVTRSPLDFDSFCIFYVIIMLLVDSFLYLVFTFYIEAVMPGHSGHAKPWYFPVEFCWKKLQRRKTNILHDEEMGSSSSKDSSANSDNFEPVSDVLLETEPVIQIKGLYKQYKKAVRKYSVFDMNMKMYRDEIIVFLGHNGAGKTTTINMITGLTKPTFGSISVDGMDVATTKANERSCGICPQFNVLWDRLTVLEHLHFYAYLKSKDPNAAEIQAEIDQIIKDLELENKRDETVSSLSGGMKRRLSIAISFVAGSRAVILDEPTAGVDPYARRAIWDLILKYKHGRTILISTHFMDEAELLADRIAVLADGCLTALGSPLFLIQKFGGGYALSFVWRKEAEEASEESLLSLGAFLESLGPRPTLVKSSRQECTYRLTGWNNKQIIELLESLKEDVIRDQLKIRSYGLRDGNMENVFLKLGTSECTEKGSSEEDRPEGDEEDFQFPAVRMVSRPSALLWQRFLAQMKKRFLSVFRNWRTIGSQLVLPAIFVAVGMSVALPAILLHSYPAVTQSTFQIANLSASPGQRSSVFYENLAALSEEKNLNDTGFLPPNLFLESLYNPSGMNAECTILEENSTWMDANYPENRSPENLKRPVEVDMLEGSCAYRRFFNSSFRPLLDYFSLPPYISGKKDPDDFYPRCECSSRGRGQHCKPSKAVNQDKKLLETGDELFDITGLESVRYLLSTHGLYPLRYGGFSFGANVSYVPEGYGVHKKEFARLLAVRHVSKVWYDNYAYHSPSIFLNALNNEVLRSALRARLNGSGNPGSFGITVVNHPFEDTEQMITPEKILQGNDILIVVFLVVALAFVPSSFVFGIVHERSTLSTHLEYLAGMPGPLYWVSNFLWHLLNYGLPALMSIVIIRLFDIPMYVASENFLGIVLLILLYGWACTPLVHLLSAFFDDASTAFLAVLVGNLSLSVSTVFTSFMLQVANAQLSNNHLEAASAYVQYVFLLCPGFALGQGILSIVITTYENEIFVRLGDPEKVTSIFKFPFINSNLIVLAAEGFFAFLLVIALDVLRHQRRRSQVTTAEPLDHKEDLDEDVLAEKRRVLGSDSASDVLRVCGVTKTFPLRTRRIGGGSVVAVDHLCVGLPRGECFGLLGVNGAGKSTTFRMLASLDIPSSGTILLDGRPIHDDQEVLHVGYCPQFDALHEELTVHEHLHFYASIFGYHREDISTLVRWLLYKMNLTEYRNALAGELSGGTRRKLATAVAVVANPPLLLFDEPSTGMDPKSRRFLWDTMRSLNASGKSIMFTSHSMEECEELCHRIAIMVNGRLKCLGSSQQLKTKYGDGYSVRFRLTKSASLEHRRTIKKTILSAFAEASLTDANHVFVQFALSGSNVDIARLFSICETLVGPDTEAPAQSFSVAQRDLSNLFVSLVREQAESTAGRLLPYPDAQLCPVATMSDEDVSSDS